MRLSNTLASREEPKYQIGMANKSHLEKQQLFAMQIFLSDTIKKNTYFPLRNQFSDLSVHNFCLNQEKREERYELAGEEGCVN
jgi:hypothetical protein